MIKFYNVKDSVKDDNKLQESQIKEIEVNDEEDLKPLTAVEINNTPTNGKIEKNDKQSFEDFKNLYKGVIDMKCNQEYGSNEDKDLWEDCAKELFLKSKTYLLKGDEYKGDPVEKKEESKTIIKESYYIKLFNKDNTDIDTIEVSTEQEAIKTAEEKMKEGWRAVVYNVDNKEALYDYNPFEELEESLQEEITPANIKEKALEILPKEDVDVKDSDLYIKVSDKSKELISKLQFKNSGLLTTFRSPIDNEMWYDIPFANLEDYITSKTESNNNTYDYKSGDVVDILDSYGKWLNSSDRIKYVIDRPATKEEIEGIWDIDTPCYIVKTLGMTDDTKFLNGTSKEPITRLRHHKTDTSVTESSDNYQVRKYPNEDEYKGTWGLYDLKQNKFIQKGSKYVMQAALKDMDNKQLNESFDLDLIEKNIKGKRLSDAAKYLGALVNGDRNSFKVVGTELISKLDSNDRVMCAVKGNDIIGSIVMDLTYLTDKTESKKVKVESKTIDDLQTIQDIEEYINNIKDEHTKSILHHILEDEKSKENPSIGYLTMAIRKVLDIEQERNKEKKTESMPDDWYKEMFNKYVPNTGEANTIGGEILRTFSGISRMFYQNGDKIWRGNMKNNSYVLDPLADKLDDLLPQEGKDLMSIMANSTTYNAYEKRLNVLEDYVYNYLKNNEDLFNSKEKKEEAETDDGYVYVHTGLSDDKTEYILNSVIGQISDGIWEGSKGMDKIWQYMDVEKMNGELVMKVYTRYPSGFEGKTEDQISKYVAQKIKQIAKINIDHQNVRSMDGSPAQWDRNETATLTYFGGKDDDPITVRDAYKVYDSILGRKQRIESKQLESRDRVAENLSKFIYDLTTDKDTETYGETAWSGNQPTKMGNGVTVYEVYKNGKSNYTIDDIKKAVIERFPELDVYGTAYNSILFYKPQKTESKLQEDTVKFTLNTNLNESNIDKYNTIPEIKNRLREINKQLAYIRRRDSVSLSIGTEQEQEELYSERAKLNGRLRKLRNSAVDMDKMTPEQQKEFKQRLKDLDLLDDDESNLQSAIQSYRNHYIQEFESYTKKEENNTNLEYNYMLLDRLRSDCEYFLGNGNRNEKDLWAGSVDAQINEMKKIWNSLKEKPEWLTMEDINNYEKLMKDKKAIRQSKNLIKKYNKELKDSKKEESVVSDYTLNEIKKVIDSNGNDFTIKIVNSNDNTQTKTLNIDREDLISVYNVLGGNKDELVEDINNEYNSLPIGNITITVSEQPNNSVYLEIQDKNNTTISDMFIKTQIQTIVNFLNRLLSDNKNKPVKEESSISDYTLTEALNYENLVVLNNLGETQFVKARKDREDKEFKKSGAVMISNNDPNSLKNAHDLAIRAQSCIYKLEDIQSELNTLAPTTNYNVEKINRILADYGFDAYVTDLYRKNLGNLDDVSSCQNFVLILINQLQQIKEKDLNESKIIENNKEKDPIYESRPDKEAARDKMFRDSKMKLKLPNKFKDINEIVSYLENCEDKTDVMNVNVAVGGFNRQLHNDMLQFADDFIKENGYLDTYIDEDGKEQPGKFKEFKQAMIDFVKNYDLKTESKEVKTEGTNLKRIARYNEFDNGYVLHNDWKKISDEEAEELAKQASIKDPTDVYYVQFDDIMNSSNNNRWYKGKLYTVDEINAIRRKEKEDLLKKVQQEKDSKTESKEGYQDKCCMCGTSNLNGCYSVLDEEGNVGSVCVDCGKKYSLPEIEKKINSDMKLESKVNLKEDQYEYNRRKGRPNVKKIAEDEYYDNQDWYIQHIKDYDNEEDFIKKEIAEIAEEYNLKENTARSVCKEIYKLAKENNLI